MLLFARVPFLDVQKVFSCHKMNIPQGQCLSYVGELPSDLGHCSSYIGEGLSYIGRRSSYMGEDLSYIGRLSSYLGENLSDIGRFPSYIREDLSDIGHDLSYMHSPSFPNLYSRRFAIGVLAWLGFKQRTNCKFARVG